MEAVNKFGPLFVGQGFGHDGYAHSPCTAQPALWYHGKEDAKDAILYSVVGTERRNARSSTNVMFCQRFRVTARSSGERLKVSTSSSDMLMSTVIAATAMHQLVCLE